MKHINFLPGADRKKSYFELSLMRAGLVFLVLILASFGYAWWFKRELNLALNKQDQLSSEVSNLKTLKSAQDIKNLVASKNTGRIKSSSLAVLMQDLQQKTPSTVQIHKIANSDDAKMIMIEASIKDQGAVAKLGDSFREVSWCEKFRLDNLSTTESEQGEQDSQIKFSCPQE